MGTTTTSPTAPRHTHSTSIPISPNLSWATVPWRLRPPSAKNSSARPVRTNSWYKPTRMLVSSGQVVGIVAGNGVKTYKQVSHEYITVLSIAAERSPNEKGAGIGQNLAHHR